MNTTDSTPSVSTDEAARRRRIRGTALGLGLFAIVVYVGFIIAFINRHQ
jgi:hypothetical protein